MREVSRFVGLPRSAVIRYVHGIRNWAEYDQAAVEYLTMDKPLR